MKTILKLYKLLAFIALCLPLSAIAKGDVETFYKDPTYTNFMETSERFNYLENSQDPYLESKFLVFTTMVLHKHPDFKTNIINDFGSFNDHQKSVIYQGLLAAGFTKEANEISLRYHYTLKPKLSVTVDKINALQFMDDLKTRQQIDLQAAIMDYCWVSFFATGEEKYIGKLVEYAKKHEDTISHFIPVQAYFWSSGALSKQDPNIKEILVKLNAPGVGSNPK